MLGTSCGTLAVAAVVSAVYPAPHPVLQSDRTPATSQDDVLSALSDAWLPIDESEPRGGPLEIPTIGAVRTDYDEQMEALDAARRAAATPAPPAPRDGEELPSPEPTVIDRPPIGELPAAPPDPAGPSPVDAPAVNPQPPDIPPVPAVTDPAPSAPESPTEEPAPSPPAPAEEPPPPADEPPPPPPPAVDEPPPPPPAPVDTALAVGERYELEDAEGKVVFTITLLGVDTALSCTAAGSLPAQQGHLIGLQVEVLDLEPRTEDEPPSVSAADFRFVGVDDVLTEDVGTDSSAACLEDGWPSGQPGADAPVQGTVVLDVPAVTGTLLYRPAAWPAGLRWVVPPAE